MKACSEGGCSDGPGRGPSGAGPPITRGVMGGPGRAPREWREPGTSGKRDLSEKLHRRLGRGRRGTVRRAGTNVEQGTGGQRPRDGNAMPFPGKRDARPCTGPPERKCGGLPQVQGGLLHPEDQCPPRVPNASLGHADLTLNRRTRSRPSEASGFEGHCPAPLGAGELWGSVALG